MKKLLSYLKYLTPIVITKHSFDFDYKIFIKKLRLKTQSPFGDEKTLLRDKKIGRIIDEDKFILNEFDSTLILKENPFKKADFENYTAGDRFFLPFPSTFLKIYQKKKITIVKVNYPGIKGTFYLLLFTFPLLLLKFDLFYLIILATNVYLLISFQIKYNKQNKLIEEVINEINEDNNILPLNPPPKGEV